MTQDIEPKLEILGLSPTLTSRRLLAKLKMILKGNHPDTTGGNFRDQQQRLRYETANEALEILKAPVGRSGTGKEIQVLAESQIALAETQSVLLKIIDEQRQLEQQKAAETSESRANSAIAHSLHQRYASLRLGGWSIAAISAAIALMDKPLGGLIEDLFGAHPTAARIAKLALGIISVFGLVLGLYARQREAREVDRIKSIMTVAGIQHLLYRYDYIIFRTGNETVGQKTFNLSTLSDAIANQTGIEDRSTCEATAEAIIKKMVQSGFANVKPTKGLSPTYTVDRVLTDDISEYVHWDAFERPTLFGSRSRRYFTALKRLFSKKNRQ